MGRKRSLVCGVGVNDVERPAYNTVDGKRVICSFYLTWSSMLARCYSKRCAIRNPTYIGCKVCDEWLLFSNFKAWMESQDWKGKELDKDILIKGNKVYSPASCAFVDKATNMFMTDSKAIRGDYPIGVCYDKRKGKLISRCCNPFTKKQEHLGEFSCEKLAHEAWRSYKNKMAWQLADIQTDKRISEALRSRYS